MQAPIEERVKLSQPKLAVLLWASLDLIHQHREPGFAVPSIIFYDVNLQRDSILKLGQANYGINPTIETISNKGGRDEWKIFAFLGIIPPGDYLLNLKLALLPRQKILIDGLQLFLVDITSLSGYK